MAGAPDVVAALRVSVSSVVWTMIACTAAVVVGLAEGTLVLVAFGATGLLDAAGSLALVFHFRHALAHEALSSHRERGALRLVSVGLVAIAVATLAESARRLIAGSPPGSSATGIVIAGSSLIVLTGLSIRKVGVARRLGSRALETDGWLSATGAALAAVTVGGTVVERTSDVSWADPVAAIVVAALAGSLGVRALRREADAVANE